MSAANLLEHVAQLHEKELYESLTSVVSFVLSLPEYVTLKATDLAQTTRKYQLLVYHADGLYHSKHYKKAALKYNEALNLRKTIQKLKTKGLPRQNGVPTEIDVKYKLYKCCIKLKDLRQAMLVLEGIAPKQRSTKMNMVLGKLYRNNVMERSAITCFKEVLRSCPYTMEAALALLDLAVPLQEVMSLISTASQPPEWLTHYLKGYAFSVNSKHNKAVQIFRNLESQNLKGNCDLLARIAESHYRVGDRKKSIAAYERIRLIDKNYINGMDIYAQLLSDSEDKSQLQKLAKELSDANSECTESWIALSYYCFACQQKARAVYFAQKAHVTDSLNVQALLLKASLLHSLNNTQECLVHYREAIRIAPTRFESYSGLVDCLISCERNKEAICVARNAHKTVGPSARTLTLCAKVYAQETCTQEKSKNMLRKALSHDASHFPAVMILCELLLKDQQHQEAEEFLRKQLEVHQTAKLYRLLGDCLKETGKVEEGVIMYNKALRLDPENASAMEGIQSVERNASDLDISEIGGPRDRSSIEDLELASGVDWID